MGKELIDAHIERRKANPKAMKKFVENAMKRIGKTHHLQRPQKLNKRARCALCDRSDDSKTSTICGQCSTPICHNHHYVLCDNCVENQDSD